MIISLLALLALALLSALGVVGPVKETLPHVKRLSKTFNILKAGFYCEGRLDVLLCVFAPKYWIVIGKWVPLLLPLVVGELPHAMEIPTRLTISD